MNKKITDTTIANAIFKKLYGHKPHNVNTAYDIESSNFFTIRNQARTCIRLFSNLAKKYCNEDNYPTDNQIKELAKQECEYRIPDVSALSLNASSYKRTLFINNINRDDFKKITFESIVMFLHPHLEILKVQNPIYYQEYMNKLSFYLIYYKKIDIKNISKSSYLFQDLTCFITCLFNNGELPATDYLSKIEEIDIP